jgi:tellurite resistance protein
MATVLIELPDQLVQQAERAGLLTPVKMEAILREQLRERAAEQLFSAMDRMASVDEPPYMSAEEIAKEIKTMRAERRVARSFSRIV